LKRRAKFEKQSIVDRVADYLCMCPDASVLSCSKELGLTTLQVQGAMKGAKKKLGKDPTETADNKVLNEKDILAIAKIGVAKTERILRLLKAMQ